MRTPGHWSALFGLVTMICPACVGCGTSPQEFSKADSPRTEPGQLPIRVSSPDDRISVTLPSRSLVVHGFDGAISAVAADGGARYYFEYLGEGELLKRSAATKDQLARQGWEIDDQRHFETAVHVRWRRGSRATQGYEVRDCWWLSSGKVLISCEAQYPSDAEALSADELQAMCQSIEVSRLVSGKP